MTFSDLALLRQMELADLFVMGQCFLKELEIMAYGKGKVVAQGFKPGGERGKRV